MIAAGTAAASRGDPLDPIVQRALEQALAGVAAAFESAVEAALNASPTPAPCCARTSCRASSAPEARRATEAHLSAVPARRPRRRPAQPSTRWAAACRVGRTETTAMSTQTGTQRRLPSATNFTPNSWPGASASGRAARAPRWCRWGAVVQDPALDVVDGPVGGRDSALLGASWRGGPKRPPLQRRNRARTSSRSADQTMSERLLERCPTRCRA